MKKRKFKCDFLPKYQIKGILKNKQKFIINIKNLGDGQKFSINTFNQKKSTIFTVELDTCNSKQFSYKQHLFARYFYEKLLLLQLKQYINKNNFENIEVLCLQIAFFINKFLELYTKLYYLIQDFKFRILIYKKNNNFNLYTKNINPIKGNIIFLKTSSNIIVNYLKKYNIKKLQVNKNIYLLNTTKTKINNNIQLFIKQRSKKNIKPIYKNIFGIAISIKILNNNLLSILSEKYDLFIDFADITKIFLYTNKCKYLIYIFLKTIKLYNIQNIAIAVGKADAIYINHYEKFFSILGEPLLNSTILIDKISLDSKKIILDKSLSNEIKNSHLTYLSKTINTKHYQGKYYLIN